MKKNNKKGFTIVELVIVIAVIAILAAVLIPTFSSIIKKAKVNNDIQLVRNLNTALATDNKKHKTMQDALDAAFEFGYDVAKINDTSVDENEILWDSKNDVFCYLKDGTLEYVPNSVADGDKLPYDSYLLWKISDTVDPVYSTYLYGYEGTTVTAKKGLDVGTTKGITAIKYENTTGTAQKVVIRTDSSNATLEINAPLDTVNHHGDALSINIIAVKSESYHEHGTVLGNVEIASGRVVVESSANVSAVVATANEAKIEVKSGAECGAVAKTENVTADIEITGVEEVATIDSNVTSKFAGGLGTEASPYLIANLEQWANLCQSDESFIKGKNSFKVIADLDFSQGITEETYFTKYCVKDFQGSVDFGNHLVKAANVTATSAVSLFYYTAGNVTAEFTNLNFYLNDCSTIVEFGGYYYDEVLSFKNINTYGNITGVSERGNGYSLFVSWNYPWGSKFAYENCKNYANVTACASAAGIFCAYSVAPEVGEISFKDCENYGTFVNVQGAAGMLIANAGSGYYSIKSNISIDNCSNHGTIIGNTGAHLIAGNIEKDLDETNTKIANGEFSIVNKDRGVCQKSVAQEILASDGKYSLPKVNNASYYEIRFVATFYTGNGAITSVNVRLTEEERATIELWNYAFVTGEDSLNLDSASVALSGVGRILLKDGKYILSNDTTLAGHYITQQPKISYVAYDESGKILAYYNFK